MEMSPEVVSDDDEHLRLYICDDPPSPSLSSLKEGFSILTENDTCRVTKKVDVLEKQEHSRVEEASTIKSKTQAPDEGFSWSEYLRETKSKAAAQDCFFQDPNPPLNNFKVDMKVEVPDLRGNGTQCLATIQHVHSVWVCVRLDGEDASNDHWMICDDRSILPVGANKKKGNPIQPPYGYKYNISGFHKFVENQLKPRADGKTPAAPSEIFRPISSTFHPQRNKFEVGMKCEAIDYKNFNGRPCPATIVEVEDDYVTINFDGWNDSYNLKMRYDSRYLFPVGWSAKNGLAINPPRKMQGKAKSGSIRKETNRKFLPISKSRVFTLKNKTPTEQQLRLKKRKSASSTSSAPPGRRARIPHRRSSSSLQTSSQKSDSDVTSALVEENSKPLKVEDNNPAIQAVSSSRHEQIANVDLVKEAVPLQRPVARKTISISSVQHGLTKRTSTVSKSFQNVRINASTQSTCSPAVPLSPAIMCSSSQSPSLPPIKPSQHSTNSPSSTQFVQAVQQSQALSGSVGMFNKNLRLLAPKLKTWSVEKKLGDAMPRPAFFNNNVPASDIILTASECSMRAEIPRMTVYFNRYCNCAPMLDSKKVEKLPSQIGPASHHHVFRETLQQIINCSVDTALVFKEIKSSASHILCITAEINGATHVRALPILQSPSEAWERVRELTLNLKVCPNFLRETRVICQNCKPENDPSLGDSSDSGRSSHPHLSESGDSVSSGDGVSRDVLANWSIERVAHEVEIAFDPVVANRFHQNQIDGQALMLLSTDLLMQYLEMPFGPALKMVSFVDTLKKKYHR